MADVSAAAPAAQGPIALLLEHRQTAILTIALLFLAYLLYKAAYGTDIPHIRGIPEPSGAVPFYGHIKAMGDDHPSALENWSVSNAWPLLQAKLGNRRIIVLNTFEAAQHFIQKNASATIDRPIFWTFHKMVSNTQGATIGTSPWDASCKRKRTAVGAFMTRPAIQRNAALYDIEIHGLVSDMFAAAVDSSTGGTTTREVDPRIFFLRATLNFTTLLCYAARFDDVADPLLHDILTTAHAVSTFRSTNNNTQDYVPFLRYLPNPRNALARRITAKRDVWLEQLLGRVRAAVAAGKPVDCIAEGLLRGDGEVKLTEAEIRSINVGLVSGGFETLATTGIAGLGFLSTAGEGQRVQARAYDEIMRVYGSAEEAWEKCLLEENVEYVVALVREMLRYYCAIQLLPPRQTFKEMEYNGVRIPKGVTVYMNAQAINHDKTAYGPDADKFRPERWLDPDNKFKVPAPYHYSYGAGSRACTAVALSNRILYATFVRLIIHFKFTASEDAPPTTDYIDFNENRKDASVLPKRYRLKLEEREPRDVLLKNLEQSKNATSHLVLT
ncbi:putative cytochrome p450 protein [Neofusicoccum parvum UCRNP2]|uniref:Putative cytochrome p450 protein n=1 Tax=Botryosphaeria parva (strain UCR-NP2) TaxID=1287680 RepID=R1GRP6_BOTPV|nr:putative cytochrome p450 protein [Neofusicoccum parvum UCRNP2]